MSTAPDRTFADRLAGPGWVALAGLALVVAALPTDRAAQAALAAAILALMALLLARGPRGLWRYAFLGLAVFLSVRYVVWRTANTISWHDGASFAAALLLYAAELYAVALYFLSAFVNARPLRRPVAPRIAPDALPTVDILIPTYDEPIDILRVTLVAACRVRYPKEKRRVYLLDDGGTDQKRNQADPVAAEAARYRQRALIGLCRAVGAHYLTRPRNEHAKAGNLNAALPRTAGELVLVVDADHVPTPDILERSVGFFVEDPDLALVQTPHFFVAPDPIEKNLGTFRAMPGEYEMFYRIIQPGLDFWNASLFCGSAAILRRRHLASLGGFAATTVTEDAETSLALHARGLKSRYIPEPMVAGLVPDTFEALVRQRTRWAQGMTQLFIRDNPILKRGLSPPQRLCYLAGMLFWQFPFARVVFLLAPLAFLLLGLRIYDANLWDVAVYALPHLVASALVSRFLFAGARWPFVSSVYETMLALFTGRALLSVYRRPAGPRFRVTPKGHTTATAFIAPLARPFYVLLALYALAVPAAIVRAFTMPDDLDTVCITAAWGLFNLALLVVALGALYERKQRRQMPRMPIGLDAALVVGRGAVPAAVADLSIGGVSVALGRRAAAAVARHRPAALRVVNPTTGAAVEIPIVIRNVTATADGVRLGLAFVPRDLDQFGTIVDLVHGDAARWLHFLETRSGVARSGGATFALLGLGFRGAFDHVRGILRGEWGRASAPAQPASPPLAPLLLAAPHRILRKAA